MSVANLNHFSQKKRFLTPVYTVSVEGPPFTCTVQVGNEGDLKTYTSGDGNFASKKAAKEAAAEAALCGMSEEGEVLELTALSQIQTSTQGTSSQVSVSSITGTGTAKTIEDYVSQLNIYTQKMKLKPPKYEIMESKDNQTFTSSVRVTKQDSELLIDLFPNYFPSKREAKMMAAFKALEALDQLPQLTVDVSRVPDPPVAEQCTLEESQDAAFTAFNYPDACKEFVDKLLPEPISVPPPPVENLVAVESNDMARWKDQQVAVGDGEGQLNMQALRQWARENGQKEPLFVCPVETGPPFRCVVRLHVENHIVAFTSDPVMDSAEALRSATVRAQLFIDTFYNKQEEACNPL